MYIYEHCVKHFVSIQTHVQLNNNMLLRMREYFDAPDEYVPERWVRGGSAQLAHPYLLLPFGFGPRTCAGTNQHSNDNPRNSLLLLIIVI